jgi:hypothetical protein
MSSYRGRGRGRDSEALGEENRGKR